jgi:hypothetical protein
MQRWAIAWCLAMLLMVSSARAVWSQTVQFPSAPVQAFPQQISPQTPFATPGPGTFAAPRLSPSAPIGPPPAFDAYAPGTVSGTGVGPAPSSVPYNVTPGPAATFPQPPGAAPGGWQGYPNGPGAIPATTFPQQNGLFTDGLPFDWQQGSYGYQSADGGLVRFQKFLQRIGVENTWLAGDHGPQDFEINRTEIAATFGVPVMHNVDTPLLVTPGFAFNWLEGPVGDPMPPMMMPRGPDLPGQLYDAYLDLSWYPQPFEWFGAELGFRTGVWTDFDTVNSQSVRFLGRGLGVISVSPQMEVLIGVVYLDRLSVKLLPAGGVHWRPNQDWDLYLVFPNPKLRRRFQSIGNTQWWWYVTGEYGGGSWTVNRVGLDDRIDYNDIRAILGLEWETPRLARGHLEIGYVFDREILFQSAMPVKATPDETVMLRAGIDF